MHVLIIESSLSGHHAGYFERIAAAYIEAGHTVTTTCLQRDAAHPSVFLLKSKFGDAFNVLTLDDTKYDATFHLRLGIPAQELALRKMFGLAYRAVHEAKPVDYVFLPYLDYCLYALGLLGSPFGHTKWGGICMRPSFHYSRYDVIAPKQALAKFKLLIFLKLLRNKTLSALYTIDELLYRFVVEEHSHWASRLQYLSDPAELNGMYTYLSARQALGIPESAIVVLVYGVIDGRKGLDALLEAMCGFQILTKLHLLLVGRQSASIEPLMQSAKVRMLIQSGRCHIINTFIDDIKTQQVFVATDVVWLGYKNHYTMSGVLVLAGLAKKPVVATSDGLIGWYTRKNKLGETININNQNSIVEAFTNIFNQSQQQNIDHDKILIFEKFTWKNFLNKILKTVDK